MHTFGRERGLRWCLSGFATLIAHGVVIFALPDAAPLRAAQRANDESVWFATVDAAEVGDAHESRSAPTAIKPRDSRSSKPSSPRPAAGHRARKPRLSEPPDDAPPLARSLVADALHVGALATRDAAREPAKELTQRLEHAADGRSMAGAHAGGDGSAGKRGLPTGRGRPGGHGPGLLAVPNACRGFFPAGAKVDHGEVRITVQVDARGHPRASRLLTEMPLGQGFGRAAQACALALRFTPAVDGEGSAIVADTKLELRFDRS